MSDQKFQSGDVVRDIPSGIVGTIGNITERGRIQYMQRPDSGNASFSVEEIELVYRPPSRESVEALREALSDYLEGDCSGDVLAYFAAKV